MSLGDVIRFGEYLPDLPFFQNPGLVEAKNCIPVDGAYKDFLEILTADDALSETVKGAYAAIDEAGDPEIYAGTTTLLLEKTGSTWTDRAPSAYATASTGYWRFVQFDDKVIATNYANNIQVKTVGAAADFADLDAGAPKARQIGVINRFVVVGDTVEATNGTVPYKLQWCAIDDPTDWPIPDTADALAKQSGEQFMDASYGAVTAIAGGQFFGIIYQQRAITRMTYIGGDRVFQFETFEKLRGCWAPQSMTQVGQAGYFLAADGWYVTDGQVVKGIGDGKIDKTFYSSFDPTYRERVTSGVDLTNKVIHWCIPTASSSSGIPNQIWTYNLVENRWTHSDTVVQMLLSSYTQGYTLEQLDSLYTSIDDITISLDSPFWSGGTPTVAGFLLNKLGTLSGDALTARFESGEIEVAPPGLVYINGVKPLVTGDPTAVSTALAVRASQDNASRSFGGAVTRTSRTGVCDFRTQGRYASARIDIAGGFDRAMGFQFEAEPGDGL